MHRLDKSTISAPSCLVGPPSDRHYSTLKSNEKAEIRAALLTIQAQRCAYCERRTGNHANYDGHIEHFFGQDGPLSLDWSNLFWSCNDERTCGKHKDQCRNSHGTTKKFDPQHLVNPGCDDPEVFLLFMPDGRVQPRGDLSPEACHRAEETIRVFQLNESACLERSRLDAISPYIRAAASLQKMGPDALRQYVASELAHAQVAPFGTAIKHFLTSICP